MIIGYEVNRIFDAVAGHFGQIEKLDNPNRIKIMILGEQL
jgi:hypothetical protein